VVFHICRWHVRHRLGAQILHSTIRRHNIGHVFVVVFQFHKIRNVEEGIALQANVDEGGLHAGQHAGYPAFVDGPREGVFIFALEVDFREQIVFHQPHFSLVRRRRNKQLFVHGHSGPAAT